MLVVRSWETAGLAVQIRDATIRIVRPVMRPRKAHWCDHCRRRINGPHVAMFGAAEPGDKPYWLRLHGWCGSAYDARVIAASRAIHLATLAAFMAEVYHCLAWQENPPVGHVHRPRRDA